MSDDSHARLLSCHTDTNLTFDNAILVQSNLGAQGGRCVTETFRDGWTSNWEDLCRNPQPGVQHGPSASYPYGVFMPHVFPGSGQIGNTHVLFENLGYKLEYDGNGVLARQDLIWLQVTNETEYRAW